MENLKKLKIFQKSLEDSRMNKMKILDLKIEKIRGIKEIRLTPNGKNLVICGPNGSGKSAVVDALDFLLTGSISRFTGKGTGCISLSEHGPHVDHQPVDAIVSAKIKIPASSEPIEIRRCMAKPSNLECDDNSRLLLEPIINIAQNGQYVLTRREILKYITAEPSTRAKEIQDLLNITEIDDARKIFGKIENNFRKEIQSIKGNLESDENTICATLCEKTFNEIKILELINKNRAVLGGCSLDTINSRDLKSDLILPATVSDKKAVNIILFDADLKGLKDDLTKIGTEAIFDKHNKLLNVIDLIKGDANLLHDLKLHELIKLGIKMADDTGCCPLCSTPWPPGELQQMLNQKLHHSDNAAQYKAEIDAISKFLKSEVSKKKVSINKIISVTQLADLECESNLLQSWLDNLDLFVEALNNPLDKYQDLPFKPEEVQRMLAPNGIIESLNRIDSTIKAKYPATTPEQMSWEILIRLEENINVLEDHRTSLESMIVSHTRAKILSDSFQTARDLVLNRLYEGIRERFEDLYRQLHGQDEIGFSSKIKPDGAALNFEVDFYGRGNFPPHALHSEGHQDSMGLCLYLALSEQLNKGLINLTILDDVVMSVDADHRRELCHLLARSFPDQQFIITTHDKTWANQLKTESVVKSEGLIEFYNWHIDTGPSMNYEQDMWEKIMADIAINDIPSAAHRLRRGSEQFFEEACDALHANVRYRLDNRRELSDFLYAAMHQYKELLKLAKTTAQSWNNDKLSEELKVQDSIRKSVFERSNAEYWAINPNVHYNSWANFSKKDFIPVAEAFKDLFDLFKCNNCGGLLRLTTTGMDNAGVRCNCGKIHWNLIKNK